MDDVVISKAEYLDRLRCEIQQLAIEFYEYSQTLNDREWAEFEGLAGTSPFDPQGFSEDLEILLENGSF